MLTNALVTTSLGFGCLYPLFFWVNDREVVKTGFYRFNLGFCGVIGGLGVVSLWRIDAVTFPVKGLVTFWFLALLAVSAYFWNRDRIKWFSIASTSVIGIIALFQVQNQLISYDWMLQVIGILSGLVLCASIFAGVLGHWYLNVENLPINLLMKATRIFWGLVTLRLIWNLLSIMIGKVTYLDVEISLFRFIQMVDGLLLSVGLFFGTIFPFILLYFVHETVKLKSTQSATGILYVVSISVLMGDFAYKYYLIQYGLAL